MAVAPDDVEVIERPTDDTGLVVRSMSQGELESQIELARRYPRDIKQFIQEAKALATLSEEIAAECMYSLPARRNSDGTMGKPITGPSARFAEIVASCWGNCHSGARTIGEDDHFVTSQGVFRDLQRNYTVSFEARRRITSKKGTRFGDDMIAVTANAAGSIALRNAVFKGVPKAFWKPIYDAACETAIGKAKTIAQKWAEWKEYLFKMRVEEDRILSVLSKTSPNELVHEDFLTLRGLVNSIKEGELSVEQAFPAPDAAEAPKTATDALKERLASQKKQPQAPQAETKAPEPAGKPETAQEAPQEQQQAPEPAQASSEPAINTVAFKDLNSCQPGERVRVAAKVKRIVISTKELYVYSGALPPKPINTGPDPLPDWVQTDVDVLIGVDVLKGGKFLLFSIEQVSA